jgi:lipopolysaccharide biosynthesis glycosyltransferase
MSADCAVCYVSDLNFLLPTLVSAAGLRKFVPRHKADINIFLVDQDIQPFDMLNSFLKTYEINVLPLDSRSFSGFDAEKFKKSYLSTATLGRFFIEGQLPPSCKRIVYIDGDTWIRRDPSPLIDAVVPEGRFAAVEDMLTFRCGNLTSYARSIKEHFNSLGLQRKFGYFNTGVFAVSRDTWRGLAAEGYRFFLENTAACTYHDQSALNAIMGDRRLPLSLKWNFQTSYRHLGIEKTVKPCIYHFSQFPKPWMGVCAPWEDIYPDYQAALVPFSSLQLPIRTLSAETINAHNAFVRKKFLPLKLPFVANLIALTSGIVSLESKTWLAA